MPQRKLVEMGQVIGRIISLNQVLEMGDKGFRKDLIDGGVAMLQQEISSMIDTFSFKNNVEVVVEYEEKSGWLNYVTR
jgi:hypothetical protein